MMRSQKPNSQGNVHNLILENVPEIIYFVETNGDPTRGSVKFVSSSVEEIVGYTRDEFTKNPALWVSIIHPDDAGAVQRATEEMFAKKTMVSRQYRLRHKVTGEYIWMEYKPSLIIDGAGKIAGYLGVARDITERKRAEEERLRLLQVLESSLNEIYMFNVESLRFTYVNDGARKNLGYSMDELQLLTPLDLKPEYTEETFMNMIRPLVLREKEVHIFETIHRRKNGTLYPVEVHLQFVETVGSRTFVAIIHDITERKQAEEIARVYTERLQVLSKQLLEIQENERRSIARELHDEIGQTLTSLKILLEMSTKVKAENARESLQEALGLISSLIGRVRNLSLDLCPPALDDLGLVPAIRWHLLHRTEKMGIKAHFKAEPEEIDVSGEIKTACFRVAQEALTNVLKHSKPKSVEVQVMKRGANLELAIRDDGTGFDVDSAFRRAAAGESFGLLGMQERVRLAGGTLVIRSGQGRGSEIQATFPDAFIPSLTDSERSTER